MVLLQLIFSIVIKIVLDPHQLYPQLFPFFFFLWHSFFITQALLHLFGQALSYLNPVPDTLEEGAESLKWEIIPDS